MRVPTRIRFMLRSSSHLTAILLMVASAGLAAAQDAGAVVRTTEGSLAGTTVDGVRSFKGVPYAAPPVGNLRWKPPQPVTPWKEVRAANAYSPMCITPGGGGAEGFYGGGG